MTWTASQLIRKKRDGGTHSPEEMHFLVSHMAAHQIPDYQTSAWLMAAYLKGLDTQETVSLTREIKNSGHAFDWAALSPALAGVRLVDKHSSGGIGDKVSLVLAPLAACLGLTVPMISGRGLGHTGGTVDKLESIPGFSLHLATEKICHILETVGCCMMAQQEDLCPADKVLYHLRDVTGTVESLPLITASIVSKKWAEGVHSIVYDVKCGSAAFMKTLPEARALACSLVDVSRLAGLKPRALITRMQEPLGSRVGNALEVEESLWILKNNYPSSEQKRLALPLKDLIIALTAEMLRLENPTLSEEESLARTRETLDSGVAYERFCQMARAQGATADWESQLPQTKTQIALKAPRSGYIHALHSRRLGEIGLQIGMGRQTQESRIDPAVGFEMHVAPGDRVEKGQDLLSIHLGSKTSQEEVLTWLLNDFDTFIVVREDHPPSPAPLLLETL